MNCIQTEDVLNFNLTNIISHEDGYIALSDNGGATFYYYLKDHLGNVRSVILPDASNQPLVSQANDYFPFGMSFESTLPNPVIRANYNKLKYNGKEEQEMIGRWHGVDPLAEAFYSFTPYHYVRNNPVKLFDPNGMADNEWFERQQAQDEEYIAQHDAMFSTLNSGEKSKSNKKINTVDEPSQESSEEDDEKKILEDIATVLGFPLGSIEEGMKLLLVTELELRQAFIEQGYSTKRIDRIISKSGTTGGIARISGRLLFWGQAGYNIHNMIMVDRSFENVALRSADTFFSGLATYGGLKGMAIAGTYYLGKESIIMTMKGLEQGIIETNQNMMRNYIPGLAPTPVIWNW